MAKNAELTELKIQIDAWRRQKSNRSERMPAALQHATDLAAQTYGISMVCKALNLNTTHMSKRISKQDTKHLQHARGENPLQKLPKIVRIAPITMGDPWPSSSPASVPFAVLEGSAGLKLTFFAAFDSATLAALVATMGARS